MITQYFLDAKRLWQTFAWPRGMKHCRLYAVCGRSVASSMASKGWYQDRVPRPELVTQAGAERVEHKGGKQGSEREKNEKTKRGSV